MNIENLKTKAEADIRNHSNITKPRKNEVYG